jgi:hypothetical protein
MNFLVATYQQLINALADPDLNINIDVTATIPFTAAVAIPANKIVTISSSNGAIFIRDVAFKDYLLVVPASSSLEITDLIIDGNKANTTGNDALIMNYGTLTLGSGAQLRNNDTAGDGGAVYSNGTVNINGGIMLNNFAVSYGGGIYSSNKIFITAGEISDNQAAFGGGIANSGAELIMTGGIIDGNTASGSSLGGYGGGILNVVSSTADIGDTSIISISGTGTPQGGGIYSDFSSTVNINGNAAVSSIAIIEPAEFALLAESAHFVFRADKHDRAACVYVVRVAAEKLAGFTIVRAEFPHFGGNFVFVIAC